MTITLCMTLPAFEAIRLTRLIDSRCGVDAGEPVRDQSPQPLPQKGEIQSAGVDTSRMGPDIS